jgi:tetratricopeptide (TPR) repeat protein
MSAADPPPGLVRALERLRLGDAAGARAAAEGALAEQPDAAPLLALAGLAAAQSGDPAGAIPHFRRALALAPGDAATRINLATALLATGALDAAAGICAAAPDDPKLLRIAAYVDQQRERHAEAARAYEKVVAAFPRDFESWNNLGNARAAAGDLDGAIQALQGAIAIRPDLVRIHLNLSEVLAEAEYHEARQAVMREAVKIAPDDADVQTELGLAEASMSDFVPAERAFREAIRLSSGFTAAYLELGMLLENLNRVKDLSALVEEAEARGLDEAEIDFLRAWSLRRQGRFEEAFPLALKVPASINPIRSAQLLGEVADRLGDTDTAFAAFIRMNEAALAAKPAPRGPTFREEVVAAAALLSPDKVAAWSRIEVDPQPPPPIFIVGFPRSGTTLLDTLLMNLPNLHVLEEMPVLRQVEGAVGEKEKLASLDSAEANRLRAFYFESLQKIAPTAPGRTVVDKFPLHMARMPLIHRIFPDARVILVERHPCDSLLSCFMSNFSLNHAMRSFTGLEEAARTYDAVFTAWTRAEALLPLRVHRIRYEDMVEDLATQMRALLDFLDLPWDEKVLDNRSSAAKREHIRTASYSQVTEPIYRRSSGRWRRYRDQMAPVLPILAPWAERMGYEL